jgi:hypothetical protein
MTEILHNIRLCFENERVYYSQHFRREMKGEPFGQISEQDVYETVQLGEVIEEYPDDLPYPSALIFGQTKKGRPLHIVAAFDETEKFAILITVYQPIPDLWIDYRRRKL